MSPPAKLGLLSARPMPFFSSTLASHQLYRSLGCSIYLSVYLSVCLSRRQRQAGKTRHASASRTNAGRLSGGSAVHLNQCLFWGVQSVLLVSSTRETDGLERLKDKYLHKYARPHRKVPGPLQSQEALAVLELLAAILACGMQQLACCSAMGGHLKYEMLAF
ncbi:hypothetical protein F4775DRAFT_577604 [Biscogniauxia sp. FL1348]|nr:hypothetical protein F4775DRAFT_577604 [Biscogniauxia sp. FL1348]